MGEIIFRRQGPVDGAAGMALLVIIRDVMFYREVCSLRLYLGEIEPKYCLMSGLGLLC